MKSQMLLVSVRCGALALVFSGLLGSVAQAAEVHVLAQSRVPGMANLSNHVERLMDVLAASRSADTFSVSLELKARENVVRALKQAVYSYRSKQGVYNSPDRVMIQSRTQKTSQTALELMAELISDLSDRDQRGLEGANAPVERAALWMKQNQITAYDYADGNSFGGCHGIVFTQSPEVGIANATFVGSCWAE